MSTAYRDRWNDRGFAILLALGAAVLIVHLLTGWRYGFHRDELATLDDARHLAWGYVAYPPVTPFFGWLIVEFIWNLVNWIPILCRGFDLIRGSFHRIDGSRIRRQDRRASACRCGRDSIRTRCRKSYAICFIRLFSLGRLLLLFRTAVQIARSAVVALQLEAASVSAC